MTLHPGATVTAAVHPYLGDPLSRRTTFSFGVSAPTRTVAVHQAKPFAYTRSSYSPATTQAVKTPASSSDLEGHPYPLPPSPLSRPSASRIGSPSGPITRIRSANASFRSSRTSTSPPPATVTTGEDWEPYSRLSREAEYRPGTTPGIRATPAPSV